jgi:SulP family sulfate permease
LLRNLPPADRLVFVVVVGLTVFVDLIYAVQMGFLVATLLFFKNLSNRELTRAGALTPMVLPHNPAAVALADDVQVVQAEGPIVFGTSEAFADAFQEIGHEPKAVIVRMTLVPLIDETGAFALQEFVRRMEFHGTKVVFSGLAKESENVLRNLGVIPDIISEDSVFATLAEAVEGLNARLGTSPEERLHPQPYLPKVGG